MSTATAVPALLPAGREPLAGTGALVRSALRRDRRRLLTWVVALGGTTVYAAVALRAVYPTAADRQARAALIGTPAGTLLSGPGYGTSDYTLGAMIANELALTVMVAAAVMSVHLVVRHTRAEEESGAAELLLAGAVGRRAPLTTGLAVMAVADAAVALVVAAGLAASGLAVVDSVALALGIAVTAAVFGGVAAVTAQLLEQARAATGAALAVLAAAVVVRGVGDVLRHGGSPLSWLSPIAWAQQTRAFVALRWSPLLLSVALAAALVATAFAVSRRRDVGAGLLAPRPGPAAASALLSSPVTLLARLQRAGVLGWAAGLALLGATFGSLTDAVVDMVAGNSLLAEAFAVRGSDITDSFTAVTAQYAGLCTAGFAVASVLRLRAEESTGRAELLLASPVDRRRLLGAGLTVTAGASVLLLAVAGLAAGGCAAVVTGDPAELGRQLGAVLVQLPAVLVVAGVAALLFGAAPRLAGLSWAVVCWALLAGLFGPLLGLPRWSVRLSPFGWLPAVPAEPLDAVPLAALTAVAAGLAVLALAGFRRRDLGG